MLLGNYCELHQGLESVSQWVQFVNFKRDRNFRVGGVPSDVAKVGHITTNHACTRKISS